MQDTQHLVSGIFDGQRVETNGNCDCKKDRRLCFRHKAPEIVFSAIDVCGVPIQLENALSSIPLEQSNSPFELGDLPLDFLFCDGSKPTGYWNPFTVAQTIDNDQSATLWTLSYSNDVVWEEISSQNQFNAQPTLEVFYC